MLRILLIILSFLFMINFNYGQKLGKSYFSYPDRTIEIQFNKSKILWIDHHTPVGEDQKFYLNCKCGEDNDTLIVTGTDSTGLVAIKMIIKKKNYLDVYYSNGCGKLFKRNSLIFRLKSWYLWKKSTRENYLLMFDLIERLKRLKIFNQSCNIPLKEIGNTGL